MHTSMTNSTFVVTNRHFWTGEKDHLLECAETRSEGCVGQVNPADKNTDLEFTKERHLTQSLIHHSDICGGQSLRDR